jgi:hypothetical protein
MSRGTPEHARLSARIVRLLGNALPADCEVYSSDMMLYIADVKLSTYADASVVWTPSTAPATDAPRTSRGTQQPHPAGWIHSERGSVPAIPVLCSPRPRRLAPFMQ